MLTLIYDEQFGKFSFVIINDDEIWFVAKDVCKVLSIKNHKDAVSRLDDDEKDEVGITDPIGRTQKTLIVNESGLYSLVFMSRKPEAKKFRKWVTSEVLPSIRKYGYYHMKRHKKCNIRVAYHEYKNGEFKLIDVDDPNSKYDEDDEIFQLYRDKKGVIHISIFWNS